MPDIWLVVLSSLLTLLTAIVIQAWRQINILRNGDMKELRERLVRMESKMDFHIQWHLGQEGPSPK